MWLQYSARSLFYLIEAIDKRSLKKKRKKRIKFRIKFQQKIWVFPLTLLLSRNCLQPAVNCTQWLCTIRKKWGVKFTYTYIFICRTSVRKTQKHLDSFLFVSHFICYFFGFIVIIYLRKKKKKRRKIENHFVFAIQEHKKKNKYLEVYK